MKRLIQLWRHARPVTQAHCVLLIFFASITCPLASEVTHLWTFGNSTDRIGLIGVKHDEGVYRTHIVYGPMPTDYIDLHMHIYVFSLLILLNITLIIFCSIAIYNRNKKNRTKFSNRKSNF